MVGRGVSRLVQYGIEQGLLQEEDRIYTINQMLELLKVDAYEEPKEKERILSKEELEEVLGSLLDYAVKEGFIENDSIVCRDLFDTKIMNVLMPRPSEVIHKFWSLYGKSPKEATDYYYALSKASDYIRTYRIARDLKWVTSTEYGDIDITINRSKPEKDPKMIALAKTMPANAYPKCLLCVENEGYAGRVDHPARQNHRIIPLQIQGQKWGFQYSPYVYYNEHCIVFNGEHVPMKIDRSVFEKLFDFVKQFPHYFLGSNADLPIVGGSILSHEHFQGGNYTFAMERAQIETRVTFRGFEDIEAGIVKWPMSVIRLNGKDENQLIHLADLILQSWRKYTDESASVFAMTNGVPHNTITPIARMRENRFELDLVLRNNITTEEHPLGLYHPWEEFHNIKKENIGLIEVMGLAVLPARLENEMQVLAEKIVRGDDLNKEEVTAKHADWVARFISNYSEINAENVMEILQKEIGLTFKQILECAGVYKNDEAGRAAFLRFVDFVNQE